MTLLDEGARGVAVGEFARGTLADGCSVCGGLATSILVSATPAGELALASREFRASFRGSAIVVVSRGDGAISHAAAGVTDPTDESGELTFAAMRGAAVVDCRDSS